MKSPGDPKSPGEEDLDLLNPTFLVGSYLKPSCNPCLIPEEPTFLGFLIMISFFLSLKEVL